jgi:hypothetical protein
MCGARSFGTAVRVSVSARSNWEKSNSRIARDG